jgi:hypothetical protein
MSYAFLGQNLHETADRARKYFANAYGATHFKAEAAIDAQLPLKPTWQATLNGGYILCIEVRETPFSQSLYEFVTLCAQQGKPVRLWVAVPHGMAAPTFNGELKQARELGVGVAQIADDGTAHEFHKPVPLSLFALRKTELKHVPKIRRETLKTAEDTFLSGAPDQGCQAVCQDLEAITRRFAEHTYQAGWWKTTAGAKALPTRFFRRDSWATMLEALDERIDVQQVKVKCPTFGRPLVAGARQYTNWRNTVSHKPKTLNELQKRDARLRTMFEATRDLLIEWYEVAKPLKILK